MNLIILDVSYSDVITFYFSLLFLSLYVCICAILSPGQTIATCQRNTLQHCWAQHVARVWPPCCDMLGVVGSNLTTPNMSQHDATWWPNASNMLRPTMLRCVALTCCDRLAGALPDLEFIFI